MFYADKRKKIIWVQFEDFDVPSRMSVVIGSRAIFKYVPSRTFEDQLRHRLAEVIADKSPDEKDELHRKKIETQVRKKRHDRERGSVGIPPFTFLLLYFCTQAAELLKKLPPAFYVYVTGSTKFDNEDSSQNICQ